jgi:hypothetical protein
MAFSLRVWIILGKQNTRKGSVIRSLTGLGQSNWCEVTLLSGQRLRLWAQVASLNEGRNPSKDFVASCLADSQSPLQSWYNVLLPLRLDLGNPGHEPEDYIAEFVRAEAWIESIITLGESTRRWVPDIGAPYADVSDVSAPTNEIGAKVRQFWGWR